ncbi:selenocysteine-specific translation elongation factor [Spiroplasma apis]|uniref:Selenocysteine-specific elongation factor n=1 Tax=Spiroplasma apis B31 TaxID=1276258 RepID=V5RIP3_SPIAP|nr:selenocysteine-specific translation elongation factor [Spiroplasma apis]AHB36353.1 Selenocysteine-specific elongation factor [Spiroplasma apis B31]
MKKNICLAVAGHVDHGKTTLVKILTGKDTDKLKEEKERNLSININFAFLENESINIALIDLPGHKDFIDNAVAGLSGIDGAILMIAADDGIMPQTLEHLNILKLLNINYILPIISKTDLVLKERVWEVESNIIDLFKKLKLNIFSIQKYTSKNIDDINNLKNNLYNYSNTIIKREKQKEFRLDIDRSFELKGIGTVVTGTCQNQMLSIGDQVTLLPLNENFIVKDLQSNNVSVPNVEPGQRTSIKLSNINWKSIHRGDILVKNSNILFGKCLSVEIFTCEEKEIIASKSAKIYAGCKRLKGAFKFLGERENKIYGQVVLEKEWYFSIDQLCLIKLPKDKNINKSFKVLKESNVVSNKTKSKELNNLSILTSDNKIEKQKLFIELNKNYLVSINDLDKNIDIDELKTQSSGDLIFQNNYVIHKTNYTYLKSKIISGLTSYHLKKPLSPGLTITSISTYLESDLKQLEIEHFLNIMIKKQEIKKDNLFYSLKHFEVRLSKQQYKIKNFLLSRMKDYKYNVKNINQLKEKVDNKIVFNQVIKYLININSIIMLNYDYYILNSRYQELKKLITSLDTISYENLKSKINIDYDIYLIYLSKLEKDKIIKKINNKYFVIKD